MKKISEIKNRNSEVYDIETIAGIFTYSAINIDTEEIVKFVLHKDRFELNQLIQHFSKVKGQIGFNNLNFDYPIIHYILLNYKIWLSKLDSNELTYQDIITLIYKEAQRIIEVQNRKDDNYIQVAIKQKN